MANNMCAVGCANQAVGVCPVTSAIPYPVLAPYVSVTIDNGFSEITVGNKSSPQAADPNTASIKSCQISLGGQNQGMRVILEIYDSAGSDFVSFFETLSTGAATAQADSGMMIVTWGWIAIDCNGTKTLINDGQGGPLGEAYMLPDNVTVNYEQGKIKFTIEGTDLGRRMAETTANKPFGTTDAPMHIKNAIVQMFSENQPGCTVKFMLRDAQGNFTNDVTDYIFGGGMNTWFFSQESTLFNAWQQENQTPIQAAMKWIAGLMTVNQKGITTCWNSKANPPEFWFIESVRPDCDGEPGGDTLCRAAYIVNAGNYQCTAPVLRFTPQIRYNYNMINPQGAQIGPLQAAGTPITPGCPGNTANPTGQMANFPNKGIYLDMLGGNWAAAAQQAQAYAQNWKANVLVVGIDAELQIQGDPSYDDISSFLGRTVGLAVINPFYLTTTNGVNNMWISQPNCNQPLSGPGWFILGVDHTIREGSYVTSLKLKLPFTYSDMDQGVPLGGAGGNFVPQQN